MNKYRKLMSNSLIFTIGSFGSKIITFLMVPLYTHLLTTSEYGTVDLMISTANLITPLLTLELGQAALRFTIESNDENFRNKIFSNISIHAGIVSTLIFLLLPIILHYNFFESYGFLFSVYLVVSLINTLFSQYIRGIGLVKNFAINGVLVTIITVVSNLILLIIFDLKVNGYIISLILATLISNLYLFSSMSGSKRLNNFNPDIKLAKDMVRFSMPIIPNSAMWWIINGSTRYFILFFVGETGNGLYAVANKIPTIISMFTNIFSQAWQLSSFEEFNSNDRNIFYSKIFDIYSSSLFLISSAILIIVKPLLDVIVSDSFFLSWRAVPFLILAVVYESFSSFLGTNYTAAKTTKGSFYTSFVSGIISIITSILLIPLLGIVGASISSAISFMGMFVIRYFDTRKFIKISLDLKKFIFMNILLFIQIIVLFLFDNIILILLETTAFTSFLILNRQIISKISTKIIMGKN